MRKFGLVFWTLLLSGSTSAQTLIPPAFSGSAASINITGATCPANGLNLPAANTLGICTNSIQGFQQDALQRTGMATGGATPWPATRSAFEFSNNAATPPIAHGADLNTWHWTAADGAGMALNVDSFATFSSFGFRRANGTAASPTQVLAGEQIGDIANYVRDDAGYTNGTVGLQFYALNTQTTTDHSSYMRFVAVGSGSTTRVGSMLVKANNVVLGDVDAAAAVAQTLSAQSVGAGTSNTAGANLTVNGSIGTGTGVGGRIDFQGAAAGSTGTSQNTLSNILSINPVTATSSGKVGQVSIGTIAPMAKSVVTISANTASSFTADGAIGGPYNLNIIGIDAVATRLVIDGFAAGSIINLRRADTTAASPSGLIAADQIGGIQWSGWAGASTNAYVAQKATFDAIAEATWSNTDTSTSFRWFTTVAGSTTQTQKMRLWSDGGLAVGATVVATDPGVGGVLGSGTFQTTSTTDATTTTSGALQIAGGAAIRKRVFIDGITASAGLQTAVLCQSSGGEMIADSVACLASSARFKNLAGPMEDGALAKIAALPMRRWSYKPEGIFYNNTEHVGPIAEDVAAMDPRLAGYDKDGNVRTYSTEQLLAYTIKAVQELKVDNDNLRALIETRK